MSAVEACNYLLTKFFVLILHPITGNQYTVHSSFSIIKEIDVISLFTNIHLVETAM